MLMSSATLMLLIVGERQHFSAIAASCAKAKAKGTEVKEGAEVIGGSTACACSCACDCDWR